MAVTYSANNPTDTTLVTTAETVVATLAGVTSQRAGQSVRLHGQVSVTTGGSTTAVVLRVRKDSLTGTLVDEAQTSQLSAAAGSTEDHEIVVTDALTGDIANATYVLTVSQTGAAANGSAVHASLEASLTP